MWRRKGIWIVLLVPWGYNQQIATNNLPSTSTQSSWVFLSIKGRWRRLWTKKKMQKLQRKIRIERRFYGRYCSRKLERTWTSYRKAQALYLFNPKKRMDRCRFICSKILKICWTPKKWIFIEAVKFRKWIIHVDGHLCIWFHSNFFLYNLHWQLSCEKHDIKWQIWISSIYKGAGFIWVTAVIQKRVEILLSLFPCEDLKSNLKRLSVYSASSVMLKNCYLLIATTLKHLPAHVVKQTVH